MATVNGENLALIEANKKLNGGEINGRVKVLVERYEFPAAVFAAGDRIQGPKLPADVRVLDAYVSAPSLGATGIFTLGHEATTDNDGNAIAEDANAFVDNADFGGAAALVRAGVAGKEASIGERLGLNQETQTFLECTEATAAAAGLVIEYIIEFTLD